MADKIYVGVVGIPIDVEVGGGLDLKQANKYVFYVKKPNGKIAQWIPKVMSATWLQYTVKRGDLDIPGSYILQVYLQVKAFSGFSSPTSFTVSKMYE